MQGENSGKSKAQRTREAIFVSARKLFAAHGYGGASVRDIASDAGIDPALVIRYFGSKDALFAEASDFRLALPPMNPDLRPVAGELLVRKFLDVWEGTASDNAFIVLLRSAASNERAAAKLREVFASQVLPGVSALTGEEGADRRAGLITSHLLGVAMCRYILKLPPVAGLSRDAIIDNVGRAIQAYLNTPVDRL